MTAGLKVTETVYQEIVRLRREEHLGAHAIGNRLQLSKSTVQKAFARMDAEIASNGQGPTPATPALQDVPLNDIHLTFDTQARVAIDGHIVKEYADAMTEGATFPPVMLFRDAEGYWVGDGHHRCQAALQARFLTIQADVREGGPREAFLYACSANVTHGLRRGDLDKRYVVHTLLTDKEWGRWSDREIARRCAVSHPFVGKLRQELQQRLQERSGNGYQIPATRQARRGETTYTMDTTGIGAHAAIAVPAPQAGQGLYQLPPAPRSHGFEDALGDLHSRVLAFVQAIAVSGGQAQVWQGWTLDRQREWAEQVAGIQAQWTGYAAEVQAVAPQALLTIVPEEDRK